MLGRESERNYRKKYLPMPKGLAHMRCLYLMRKLFDSVPLSVVLVMSIDNPSPTGAAVHPRLVYHCKCLL